MRNLRIIGTLVGAAALALGGTTLAHATTTAYVVKSISNYCTDGTLNCLTIGPSITIDKPGYRFAQAEALSNVNGRMSGPADYGFVECDQHTIDGNGVEHYDWASVQASTSQWYDGAHGSLAGSMGGITSGTGNELDPAAHSFEHLVIIDPATGSIGIANGTQITANGSDDRVSGGMNILIITQQAHHEIKLPNGKWSTTFGPGVLTCSTNHAVSYAGNGYSRTYEGEMEFPVSGTEDPGY